MSQEHKPTNSPEDRRINVNKSDDIDYWTRELKVPSQTLLQAVQTVGPRLTDVVEFLKTHGHLR